MTNDDIAAALDEIGTLLALKGENDFKCRAYHAAARAISAFRGDVAKLALEKKLGTIPGVGEALRDKITTLVATGRLPYLEELRASFPPGLFDLLRLPGLGPKKVKALYTGLGIDSLEKLRAACIEGRVAGLKGFGAKTQDRILSGLTFLATVGNRVRIDVAEMLVEALLRPIPGMRRIEVCGGLRRREETLGELSLVAASEDPKGVLDSFAGFPEIVEIHRRTADEMAGTAALPVGDRATKMGVTVRVVPDSSFALATLVATGCEAHVEDLRRRATEQGIVLESSWGDESEIYDALGLAYVPPELREDTGEVEAAEAGVLPELVTKAQIRGVFHNHTTASDGTATLAEMAQAARALGLEYLGIADHSQSLNVANGLSPDRVRKQWADIDALNAKATDLRILKGTEADILPDGAVDFPDDLLAGFEYVVASVHTHFSLPEAEMTARVCRALSHPAVTMLGHSTGRLLLRREAYRIDLDKVLAAAAANGKMIEINAQPSRLDLDWTYVKKAKALGIPIVINPDAHATGELALYRYGVDVARRGWLTKDEVFNTRTLGDVLAELARRKGALKK
jgi:DNA polymerase (family 10)